MEEVGVRQLRRMNINQIMEKLPFVLTNDGQPVAIVADYERYHVFTMIREVVEGKKSPKRRFNDGTQ